MITKSNITIAIGLAIALLFGIPATSAAGSTSRIQASPSQLIINDWQLILPSVSVDENTGETWVRYDLPDGSYQSYPLASGEPITEKWYKPGVQGFNTTPGGYSIEDTEEIKTWWMNGGNGDFINENGTWTEVADTAAPAATPSPADGSDSNPFGSGTVDASSTEPVSTAPRGGPDLTADPELADLFNRYTAAQKLCKDPATRSSETCANAQKLYQEYTTRMQGQ